MNELIMEYFLFLTMQKMIVGQKKVSDKIMKMAIDPSDTDGDKAVSESEEPTVQIYSKSNEVLAGT